MLSSLSRGYGTWDGSVDTRIPIPPHDPDESHDWSHRHGVTVSPRSRYGHRVVQVAEDGKLEMPKTFATRKGALMLFTAPDDLPKEVQPSPRPVKRKRHRQKHVLDLSLKLKTLERLSLSVLQFGDKLYEKDSSSISDKENKMMFNFLHELSQQEDDTDLHSQPGGDLKFYLRDLKRRASCRGYGTCGETTPHRMRSAELQDLLDELEQVWPKYGGSRSHRDSTFTGSCVGDDYFHPSSPTPSLTSTRSFSRSKVLSSHKLTASIKSLNQAGRPPSAAADFIGVSEPDGRSVISDSPLITGATSFGRFQRSKSAMWLSETSSPAYHQAALSALAARPGTSHDSSSRSLPGRKSQQQDDHRKLMTSPAPSEEVPRKHPVWVEVESQQDVTSFVSEDGRSSFVSGPESEVRGSDRGRGVMSPVKSERAMTPVKGGERVLTPSSRGDRDAMLMEAQSVLSSLVEEEDLDIPVDDVTDLEEDREEAQWPGQSVQEEGRRTATPIRSKTPSSRPGEHPMAQPLQPPYTGVMQGHDDDAQEEHMMTQQDILSRMRDASTEPDDVGSMIDARSHSRTSTITPAPRSDTPAAIGAHSEQMIQQVSDMMAAGEGSRPLSGHGSTASGVKLTADPDTLVGMLGKGAVADSGVSMDKPPSPLSLASTTAEAAKASSPATTSPSPQPPPPPPPTATPATMSSEPKTVIDQATQPTPRDEEKEDDDIEFQGLEDLGPKRRVIVGDLSPRPDDGEAKEDGEEGGEENEKGGDGTGLSERVKKEIQERDERLAKQKEEKEIAEAEKRSEEDKKKQEAEDKRLAAAERLKAKAEEAQRRKAEEALLKAKAPPETVEEAPTKSAKAKKGKEDKSKADKKKDDKPAEDASKPPTGLEALEKLKSSNQDVDLPMDKIQDFMDAQKKPAVRVEEKKKDPDIPEHMKEMFGRRTDSQVQEELEEEISKMRVAADNVLSESVLQPEDGEEGLSAEDFEAAQEALKEKMKKAQEQMMGVVPPSPPPVKKPAPPKGGKPAKGEKKGSPTRKKKSPEMSEAAKEKEAAKERKQLEKQKRLEEVMELQKKIKEKEGVRKTKEAEAKKQAEDLAERMEEIRQEEAELEQAENDAREQLQAVRKVQREEREARRKQDLEKKKQDALNKREKEKVMMDEARRKEQEMLDRIADAEMARRLREDDDAKREEEEILAQERFEAEMKDAQRQAEEEEERLRELERQAEEEAFQRLMDEKEAAEEKRWQLEIEARKMREEEEKVREKMLEEEKRLEEEQKQKEAEEEARREEERERLRELQRLEEEARNKMRGELEKRRAWAMRRREYNLEQRANLDAIKQSQGVTDPWTFSYYVKWSKESYHRPMGQSPKKKTGAPRVKPKAPAGQGATSAPSAVDVSAVPK